MYDCTDKTYLEVVTKGSRSTYFAISKFTKNFSCRYSEPSKGSRLQIFKNLEKQNFCHYICYQN